MPINIYSTRTMLAAVKNMLPTHTFLKSTFFTNTKTFVTEHVDADYKKGKRKMAPFVSTRNAGQVMKREGFVTKTYKPPMLKPMRAITTDDLAVRSMGENIYSDKTPDERAREMLADDLQEMEDNITRREEWMAAQVLFTGEVHMVGEDVDQILEFDFTNKEVLSGTALWSDASSDPLQYLTNKRLTVIQKSGITPNLVVMASDVADAFITHPQILDMFDKKQITVGHIDPMALPNGVTYIGRISRLGLDLYSYDEWYLDDDTGTEKPMVPAGTLMIGSTRSEFGFHYGAVTLMGANEQFLTYEGSRIPYSWAEKNPPVRYAQVNSRPLPIPTEVDSWYVSKVL
jgi:hypothetical protein